MPKVFGCWKFGGAQMVSSPILAGALAGYVPGSICFNYAPKRQVATSANETIKHCFFRTNFHLHANHSLSLRPRADQGEDTVRTIIHYVFTHINAKKSSANCADNHALVKAGR